MLVYTGTSYIAECTHVYNVALINANDPIINVLVFITYFMSFVFLFHHDIYDISTHWHGLGLPEVFILGCGI